MSDTHPHEPTRNEHPLDETVPPLADETPSDAAPADSISNGDVPDAPDAAPSEWSPHNDDAVAPHPADTPSTEGAARTADAEADSIGNEPAVTPTDGDDPNAQWAPQGDAATPAAAPDSLDDTDDHGPITAVPPLADGTDTVPVARNEDALATPTADGDDAIGGQSDPDHDTAGSLDPIAPIPGRDPADPDDSFGHATPAADAGSHVDELPRDPNAPERDSTPSKAVALSATLTPDAIRNQYVIQSPDKAAELARTAVLEPAHVSATEPVLATADPGAADTAFLSPSQRVVYVEAPEKPKKKGNRGVGALLAALSGVAYAILFAAVIFTLYYATTGRAITNFLGQTSFFVPVILFVVAFIVLVLIANRAGWWAYALGSIVVAVFVYFATIGVLLLLGGVIQVTPQEAALAFSQALGNPLVIASGLLAREVALWVGLAISARGRRVKARNDKALEDYHRDIEQRRAGYGTAATEPVAVA